jgi:hypothetical protein
MEEQLLHFIWHRKLYTADHLVTTSGDPVEVLHPGYPNQDQGPDFLHARLRIGEQVWAGHVEIHIRSSAWYLHQHDSDEHYKNVILHVVWEEDQPVVMAAGHTLGCLELARYVDKGLLERYRHLMNNAEWIPCASALDQVTDITRTLWLERLIAERLEHKATAIHRLLDRCTFDWGQVFFILLARQLGAPANSDAMEELTQRIPVTMLRKINDSIIRIEAILFGVAGMLGRNLKADYIACLDNEFDFLRKKFNLQPMSAQHWKFLRMRPAHFPTIRIAQLARMVYENPDMVKFIEDPVMSAKDWLSLFTIKPNDPFWDDHYHFTASSPSRPKTLGRDMAIALLINVVAPFMYVYGKHHGRQDLKDRAGDLLEQLPAERNAIVEGYDACGWKVKRAGQTQALLHLRREYCEKRRCLHCAIGLQVLK